MKRWVALNVLFTLLFLSMGCGGCSDEDSETSTTSQTDSSPIPEFEEGEIHTETLTPETLLPVIQALGYPGVTPRRIAVQFARDVVDDETMYEPGNLFTIEPPIDGTLRYSTYSTLEFVPSDGFKPGQQYTFSLQQVVSRDGAMIPPTPWTHTFTTPEFAFVELSGAVMKQGGAQVELDLRFSAPIDPARLPAYATWRYGGQRLNFVTYTPGAEPHVARVVLASTSFAEGGELSFTLDDGFPYDADTTAQGVTASVTIEAGKPVQLHTVTVGEGADGFYLEVVCKDDSAPGGTRYYYNRKTYDSYRISRRCMPEAGAEKLISINPPVDFRIGSGEAGFNILGDFPRGNYTVQIESGLRTIDGGVVGTPLRAEVTITSRTPVVSFANKGRYVPRSEWAKLPLRHLNVDEATVTVRHIPARNAAFWLSGAEQASSRTSVIVAREVVKFTSKSDEYTTSLIDVQKMLPSVEPGVYEVHVSGQRKSDALRLVPTDLNLVVKTSAAKKDQWSDSAFVWALNMKTLKAESGVKIDVIRPSGDVLSTCDTDASGGCRLSIPVLTVDDSAPFAVVAQRGDEFTYLRYQDVEADVAASTGEAYLSEASYRTAIWSDRGVYRPGETAHLAAVLRTDDYAAPQAGVPVTIEVLDARQKVLTRRVVKTNAAGVVTLDQAFADFAPTGQYVARIRVADAEVGSYRFNVEEFVPERMRVSATTAVEHYAVGEQIAVDVEAEYLFGGSAEGATVELTCRVVPTTFEPESHSDYFFGLASNEPPPVDLQTVQGTITAEGDASVACPSLESSLAFQRAGILEATAAVLEAGSGRTTTAMAKTNVHPAPFYIGLKSGSTSATSGKAVTVEGIVVDWQGKPYTAIKELDVEFIRLQREYWWYYDQGSGESNYGRNIRPVLESERKVAVGADGKFTFTATPSSLRGDWLIAVGASNARSELRLEGGYYSYYWDGDYRRDDTPRPARPTDVAVKGPDVVRVGVPAEFEIEVPFDGRMLVTAETHEVVGYEWVDVKAGTYRWKHTLQKFVPNVYVTALVVKSPYLDGAKIFAPDRAFGAKSFRVEPTDKLHAVTLTAPTEIRPNTTLEVAIDIGPQSGTTFATVAAVDEGILSLTRFATPDPSRRLFAQRALGVTTYETVGWALQAQPGGTSSSTGGDWDEDGEFGDGKGRLMPVKPVALWSGLVEIGPSGKATVKFDVPRYRGALRVMAVTADASRTGHADARVLVREPIVTQTTLPRFLSGGDEVQIPVFLTNMSGAATEVVVTLETEEVDVGIEGAAPRGPVVELKGAATQSVRLANGASGTVVFRAKALREAGGATFRVTAKSSDYTAVDEGVVPFRPNGPHERVTNVLELQNGKNSLQGVLEGWMPTSERTNFSITSNPYGHAFGHLSYLVRYPYGCLEQTTSATRPLLHIAPLVEQFDAELTKETPIEQLVAHGITRIFAMQTPSGGFAYWPGSSAPVEWATAYAVDMLLDAKEAKFDVPQERLDEAIDWLHDHVTRGTSRSYGYSYGEPYMHYVLARTGKGNVAKIQSLLDASVARKETSGRDLETQYMLKAALYLAGNRRYEKDLRAPDTQALETRRDLRFSYYSDLRRRGMMLSIFHTLFGTRREGEPLARLVADQLSQRGKQSRYYTTQELAWGTIGLGKWVANAKANFGDAKLVLDGKRPRPSHEVAGRSDRSWEIYRASEYADPHIELSGKDGKVYAIVSSEGVRTGAKPRVGGDGLKISRTYYDRNGRELEPDEVKLGDLVYTLLDVSNTSEEDLHNLVLVDRLPAGWEIENPRLGRGTVPVGLVDEDSLWEPDYMSLRDDRIEVFGTLRRKMTVKVLYTVRAVSAGDFQAPGPEVEAMYNPAVWAAGPPMRVKVRGLAD